MQEIGALRGELASVSTAKSAAEASLASATGEVERLKKSEVERKKELTRLSKQVEELSAAKSELEQRLRDRESASVRVVCMYVDIVGGSWILAACGILTDEGGGCTIEGVLCVLAVCVISQCYRCEFCPVRVRHSFHVLGAGGERFARACENSRGGVEQGQQHAQGVAVGAHSRARATARGAGAREDDVGGLWGELLCVRTCGLYSPT